MAWGRGRGKWWVCNATPTKKTCPAYSNNLDFLVYLAWSMESGKHGFFVLSGWGKQFKG